MIASLAAGFGLILCFFLVEDHPQVVVIVAYLIGFVYRGEGNRKR